MRISHKKVILILLFFLLFLAFLFELKPKITGNLIQNIEQPITNSYTRAICNKDNYCEDYKIICNKKKVVKITPTGFAIQKSENWQDSRNSKKINKLCD